MERCIANSNSINPSGNDPQIYIDGGHDIIINRCLIYGGDPIASHRINGITIGSEHTDKLVSNIYITNCISYGNSYYSLSVHSYVGATFNNINIKNCTFIKGITSYLVLGFTNLINSGVILKNNIIVGSNGESIIRDLTNINAQLITSDYNCFYNANSGHIFKIDGIDYTLAEWKILYGQDSYSISSDPLLTSDYRLQSTSPAKDTGVNLAEVTDDYEGNPRPLGVSTDMGAYEWFSKKIRNATLKNSQL
jgi:hypothetical protein